MSNEDEQPVQAVSELSVDTPSKQEPTDESEDDFGDFGDYEEPSHESNESTFVSADVIPRGESPSLNTSGSKPPKSSSIATMSMEEIRALLTPPPTAGAGTADHDQEGDYSTDNGTTPTSQALWEHLTEPTWMPLPKWEGSPIHKQLILHLGIPLNLDETLPKTSRNESGSLSLPIQTNKQDIEGLQNIPQWKLSIISPEALNAMAPEELATHIATLETNLQEARKLKDVIESKEMDLIGEKNILEGMVESLLLFSQRKQRERLKKKTGKS